MHACMHTETHTQIEFWKCKSKKTKNITPPRTYFALYHVYGHMTCDQWYENGKAASRSVSKPWSDILPNTSCSPLKPSSIKRQKKTDPKLFKRPFQVLLNKNHSLSAISMTWERWFSGQLREVQVKEKRATDWQGDRGQALDVTARSMHERHEASENKIDLLLIRRKVLSCQS